MIRGIRGATTVQVNDASIILSETEVLLTKMIEENGIEAESVASIFVSVTDDLNADFPAKAIRNIEGWSHVPIMCMKEIDVPGAIERCIRIMAMVNTETAQKDINHVYLNEAVKLRPDLVLTNKKET